MGSIDIGNNLKQVILFAGALIFGGFMLVNGIQTKEITSMIAGVGTILVSGGLFVSDKVG